MGQNVKRDFRERLLQSFVRVQFILPHELLPLNKGDKTGDAYCVQNLRL